MASTHVLEVQFKRRHIKPGWSSTRRMLCTNCWPLLNSMPGKITLHFKPPNHPAPYNAANHNLVTVWDIYFQDYRNISVETHNIIAAMPVRNENEIKIFWEYFVSIMAKKNPYDKIDYMNS